MNFNPIRLSSPTPAISPELGREVTSNRQVTRQGATP